MEEFFGSDRFELMAHTLGTYRIDIHSGGIPSVEHSALYHRREVGGASAGVQGQAIECVFLYAFKFILFLLIRFVKKYHLRIFPVLRKAALKPMKCMEPL